MLHCTKRLCEGGSQKSAHQVRHCQSIREMGKRLAVFNTTEAECNKYDTFLTLEHPIRVDTFQGKDCVNASAPRSCGFETLGGILENFKIKNRNTACHAMS